MSDWEIVGNSNNKKTPKFNATEWEIVEPNLQSESFLQKLPRNTAIGLANLGHSTLNAPYDIAKGFEESGKEFGAKINDIFPLPPQYQALVNKQPQYDFKLSDYIPHQQEYNFGDMLGQQGQPTFSDLLVQKGVEYSPEIAGLFRMLPHLTKGGATKKLNELRELMSKKKVSLDVNPNKIEDMRQFLPNTEAQRQLINESHLGDFNSLFNLQSDVGKESASRIKDWFSSAQRSHGRAGMKSVNALLDDMHKDMMRRKKLYYESMLLKEGRNDFRRYMKFRPYRNALIGAGIGSLGLKGLGISPVDASRNFLNDILSRYTQ